MKKKTNNQNTTCLKTQHEIVRPITGTFALLWWVLWFVLVKESPQEDRFIDRSELDYISNCLGVTANQHV